MIRTILAFFGYVKIPKAAVQLAMKQEDVLECIQAALPERSKKLSQHQRGARTLTQFLRSGRLIDGG